MLRLLVALSLAALVSGCAGYQLVPAGKHDLQGKAEVETDRAWSSLSDGTGTLWTQDGGALQNLLFILAIEDGKTLFPSLDKEGQQNPLMVLAGKTKDVVSFRFRKTMTEHEIAELFAASWGIMSGDVPVTTDNLSPATLAGHPGFRFDFGYTPKDEVKRKGFATGAVIEGKLFMVHYVGTAIYHFDKARADAEKVIASLKVKKS